MREITPTEFFNQLREKTMKLDSSKNSQEIVSMIELIQKYQETGQIHSAKRLDFLIDVRIKEKELVSKGFDKYLILDDIIDYIENVEGKVVKIIDLPMYPREVPNHAIEKMDQVEGIFDEYYIVYTDYTNETEENLDKMAIDKDPILLGALKDPISDIVYERLYFIDDWKDEYCHLTLEQMVSEMTQMKDKEYLFVNESKDSSLGVEDLEDIINEFKENKDDLDSYNYHKGEWIKQEEKEEDSFFKKIIKKIKNFFDLK